MGLNTLLDAIHFTQSTPSTAWVINHDLGTLAPAVDCWVINNGNLEKIIPSSVVATSLNVCTVTFASPTSGQAAVT